MPCLCLVLEKMVIRIPIAILSLFRRVISVVVLYFFLQGATNVLIKDRLNLPAYFRIFFNCALINELSVSLLRLFPGPKQLLLCCPSLEFAWVERHEAHSFLLRSCAVSCYPYPTHAYPAMLLRLAAPHICVGPFKVFFSLIFNALSLFASRTLQSIG